MKNNRLTLSMVAMAVASLLAGCGEEIGRVAFAAEASKAVTMPLKAGDVAFWTDIDVKYEGAAALTYRVELSQDGSQVATTECHALGPMSMKMTWVETKFGASRSQSGSGKMMCGAKLVKGGPTLVRATLAFDRHPRSVTLNKADLVIKQ